MDQLKAMHIFRTVAECKSFAQAAEQLDLPRPTVTNAVQSVERQLGVRLLQRTTRKVSLTAEGSVYLERCARLLGDLDDLNTLFAGAGHQPTGTVRVDLPERMAHQKLIPQLPGFLRRYPGIHVRIGSNDRYADLVGEGIDCAIRAGQLRDSSLVARRLGQMEQVNVASPGYLRQHGTPLAPADLAQHYAVNYWSSLTGRGLDWEYEVDGKLHTVAMRSMVSVSGASSYVDACLAGLGLIQGPRHGVETLLRTGELVEVLPQWRPPPMPVSVVVPHGRHLSARVRVFIDWVAEAMVFD
jgi:LysR family transcriptional regulator, regulator for bpeEF and oprC